MAVIHTNTFCWRLPHAVPYKNWRSTIRIFSRFFDKYFDRTKVCITRVFRPSCHQRRRPPLHSSHIRYSLMPFKAEMAEPDIPSTPCHADIYSAPNYYSITISVSEREKYRFQVQRKILQRYHYSTSRAFLEHALGEFNKLPVN